jgi:hypothetical protein
MGRFPLVCCIGLGAAHSHSVVSGRLAQAHDPHWHRALPTQSLTTCVHGGPMAPAQALEALGVRSAGDGAMAAT